jgi:hypothetical protein
MAARIDNLDVSLFTLDVGSASAAQSFLARLTSFENASTPTVANAKGIAQRHQRGKVTAVEDTFKFGLNMEDGSNAIQTALNVTKIDLGGASYLTQARSAKFSAKTLTDEGKALATMKKWANATGTDFSLEVELMVTAAAAHALETAAESSTAADKELALDIAFGGLTFTCASILNAVTRKGEMEKIQVLTAQFTGNGTPSAPSGSGTGLAEVLYRMMVGTAEFHAVLHPAGTAGGSRLISSHETRKALMLDLDIECNEEEIIKWSSTLQLTGGGISGNQ